MSKSQSPLTSRTTPRSLHVPPNNPDDWPDAVQLEDTITVHENHSSTELRGLLTAMSLQHESDTVFRIHDGVESHTVDMRDKTCSCEVDYGDCRHVWHILHRANRGLIMSSVDIPLEHFDAITTPSQTTTDATTMNHTIRCDECGSDTTTTDSEPYVHTTLCVTCLLESDSVKHFVRTPHDDPELVYVDHPLNHETVSSFYPHDSSMTLYEFFTDDSRVAASDTPVAVHLIETEHSLDNTFVFNTETMFVPESTLVTPTLTTSRTTLWTGTESVYTAVRNPNVHIPSNTYNM